MKKFAQTSAQVWLTLLARLVLGGVLLAAGWIKAMAPNEAQASVRVYEVLPTSVANSLDWYSHGLRSALLCS